MTPIVFMQTSVTLVLIMVGLAILIGFIRLALGPSLADRVLALDMMTLLSSECAAFTRCATNPRHFWTAENALTVEKTGDFGRIKAGAGNRQVVDGLVKQVAILGSQGQRSDADASGFVLGFVDSMAPRDAAETLLLTQMAAIHQATMMMARRLNHVENLRQQDAAEQALNKLART